MYGTVKTVMVVGQDGKPLIINESDFDSDKYTLFEEQKKG